MLYAFYQSTDMKYKKIGRDGKCNRVGKRWMKSCRHGVYWSNVGCRYCKRIGMKYKKN